MVEFSGLREKKTLCFKIRWCLNVVGLSCVSWLLVDMGEARFVSWEGFPSVHKAFTKGSISLLCSMTVWMSQALSMENLSIGFDYSAFIGHFFIWEFLSYAYCEILIDNTKVIVGHVTGAVFVRSWLWFWLLLMCGSLSPQALTLLLLMRSARFWSFSVLTLLRLSLVPGKLAVLSLPWMRQCSLHNCSSVVISIMFSFSVKCQQCDQLCSCSRCDLWRCQEDYEELAFLKKHQVRRFGDFIMFNLVSKYLLKFSSFVILGHSATFHCKILMLAFLKLFLYCNLWVNKF